MKVTSVAITLSLLLPFSMAAQARSHSVRAHVTKRGAYVARHYQTNPNHTKRDNWSTKGNVNPYTGKRGTR